MVIVNFGDCGLFLETEKIHKIGPFYGRDYDSVNKKFPGRPQSFPMAIDLTHPYKNFKEVRYIDRHGQNKQELVSTVDLSARISNNSQNIVVVLDVLH